MPKINHMKKVIENMKVFRKYFRVRQEVSDEIQESIYFIKYELQNSIETNISCKKGEEKICWLNEDGLKKLLTINPIEKQITKMNSTSENITYLVDNKKNLCQHKKFHPLTDRRRKLISETTHRDIEKSFSMTHRNTSLQRAETIYQIINRLIVIFNMIQFIAQIVLNYCI